MNYLIAEIKQRGRGTKLYKVFSDEEVYTIPSDLDNPKDYNSDYKLEDDEWFHIPDFTTTDYCLELLKNEFISADYNQIDSEQLKNSNSCVHIRKLKEKSITFFRKFFPLST